MLSDDDNEPISIDNVNKLSYLEQVLMETLRLYPTIPVFSRELEDNVKICALILLKYIYSANEIKI